MPSNGQRNALLKKKEVGLSMPIRIKIGKPKIKVSPRTIRVTVPKVNIEKEIRKAVKKAGKATGVTEGINAIGRIATEAKEEIEEVAENAYRETGVALENGYATLDKANEDLKREATILKANIDREATVAREHIDAIVTDAREDVNATATKAYRDLRTEVDTGLARTGAALEAMSEPENLGRMAIVYAASFYGGPMGSAFANAILDKYVFKTGASDEELFKSFIIGAAAGYSAEYIAQAKPIGEFAKTLPGNGSVIASNLVEDFGALALEGESYEVEDFFYSIASGAATFESGDDLTDAVFEGAVNSAKSTAVASLVYEGEIDSDEVTASIYRGMAHGVTDSLVRELIDDYVLDKLPIEQRQDLVLRNNLQAALTVSFQGSSAARLENEALYVQEALGSLSKEQVGAIEGFLMEAGQISADEAAQACFGQNFADLTAEQALSDEFNLTYRNGLDDRLSAAIMSDDSVLEPFKATSADGREPAAIPAAVGLLVKGGLYLMSAYGTYQTVNTIGKAKRNVSDGLDEGLPVGEILKKNEDEFVDLGIEVAMALSPYVKAPKILADVLATGKRLGIGATEKLVEHAKFVCQITNGDVARSKRIREVIEESLLDPKSALQREKLYVDLARRELELTKETGEGLIIRGKGAVKDKPRLLKRADKLVQNYGGEPEDWVKKASRELVMPDGKTMQAHWFENLETGKRANWKVVEETTKDPRKLRNPFNTRGTKRDLDK